MFDINEKFHNYLIFIFLNNNLINTIIMQSFTKTYEYNCNFINKDGEKYKDKLKLSELI